VARASTPSSQADDFSLGRVSYRNSSKDARRGRAGAWLAAAKFLEQANFARVAKPPGGFVAQDPEDTSMRNSKLIAAALAATMLAGFVSISTPAQAWYGHGWRGAHYGFGGWRPGWGHNRWGYNRWGYGRWGYGAGLGVGAGLLGGLALGAAAAAPYGGYWGYGGYPSYGYWGAGYPASGGCGYYGSAYPAYYGYSGGCNCAC
jgi:hypothetical protein